MDANQFKTLMSQELGESAETLDQKIEENIQKREIIKLRKSFNDQLNSYYNNRKYKEYMTLKCSDRCLFNFREDDLTRSDLNCIIGCYNKQYRYLAFANRVYSVLMNSDKFEGQGAFDDMDEDDDQRLANRLS